MLAITRQTPNSKRYLPRTPEGPPSKRESALKAEIVHLNTRLLDLEREQRITFERIAQLQQQLDEFTLMLRKLVQ